MTYVRYPLSLLPVEDILFVRGNNICHETVGFWWNRFGPMFAADIGCGIHCVSLPTVTPLPIDVGGYEAATFKNVVGTHFRRCKMKTVAQGRAAVLDCDRPISKSDGANFHIR
jgi:hypothetical protein